MKGEVEMKDKAKKKERLGVEVVKLVVGGVSSVGVAAIIGSAISHVLPNKEMGRILRGAIYIGGAALTGLVCDAAANYSDDVIDEVVDSIETTKNLLTNVETQVEETQDNEEVTE